MTERDLLASILSDLRRLRDITRKHSRNVGYSSFSRAKAAERADQYDQKARELLRAWRAR